MQHKVESREWFRNVSKDYVMILSRVIPKTRNPEFAKNTAVLMSLILIFAAFLISSFLAFGLPVVLPRILPENASESTELTVQVLTSLITGGLFLFVSWDMVYGLVGSAISAAAEKEFHERIQPHLEDIKACRKDLDECRENLSTERIVRRQNEEFYATIPSSSRNNGGLLIRIFSAEEDSLNQVQRRRIARDLITAGFAYNDNLLLDMALSASKRALNKEGLTEAEGVIDTDLEIFRQDIYAYLKAWLMLSISNECKMEVAVIKQRYPNEHSPDIEAYINAITDVKERLIRHPEVVKCLKPRHPEMASYYTPECKETALQLEEQYLGILLDELHEISRNH